MVDHRMSLTPSLEEVADIVNGDLHVSNADGAPRGITGISSDSRRIANGDLFVAIKGEIYDGHDYVAAATSSGAHGALVSFEWFSNSADSDQKGASLIIVPEVVPALQAFAAWYRRQFNATVIAVTGSSGKTTTKEIIAAILSQKFGVLKTPGNLNSQLGTAETMFSLHHRHEIAVIEVGLSQPGDLDKLSRMVKPDIGVITNVGPAHIEFFDSVKDIARAKGEILDHLPARGHAVLNADDPLVMAEAKRSAAKHMTFGRNPKADVVLTDVKKQSDGSWFTLEDGAQFYIPLIGEHQVMNSLAAITVGRIFNISDEDMAQALRSIAPAPMRMNNKRIGSIRLIDDSYNANPDSMTAALASLALLEGRKRAVLGDMLELGALEAEAHNLIGKRVAETADVLITVGKRARMIARTANDTGSPNLCVTACAAHSEAVKVAMESIRHGDVILVKGSRGMRMETIVEAIEKAVRDS